MKKSALCLAFVVLSGLCYAQQRVVAVFPFEAENGVPEQWATVLARSFDSLLNVAGLQTVQRDRIDRIIQQEHGFQLSDFSDEAKTAQLRRGLNAEWVVWGTVSVLGVSRFIIDAKIIDLNTRQTIGAMRPVQTNDIEDAIDKMDPAITDMLQRLSGGSGGQATAATAVTAAPVSPSEPPIVPPDFVYIPGGTFTMGSPASEPGREDDEVQHSVTVSGFYMGKFEVTQGEWQEVMGSNPSYFWGDNLPVENVSWYDAIEYCNRRSEQEGRVPAYRIDKSRRDPNNTNDYDNVKWLVTWNRGSNGYRLPTEAEWEYACRGGTTTPFSTGNNITTYHENYNGDYAYINDDKRVYRERTWEVGSGMPNPFGLYDMHGNVAEWCWDWYGDYSGGSDPMGAVSGLHRVARGGVWFGYALTLRSAFRLGGTPSERESAVGFRLVRP